jgi:NAD(P)H-dependent FMN reductase
MWWRGRDEDPGVRRQSPPEVVQPRLDPGRGGGRSDRVGRRHRRLAGIPLYNQDVEDAGEPASVVAFKAAIARADALLVATPEYNHGVPGVLKNAIDWAWRPRVTSPLHDKSVAVMGASPGRGSTARAQA